MGDGSQSPDILRTISKREFVKLAGLVLGGAALTIAELRYGIVRQCVSGELNLSIPERERYQQAVEGLFRPVTDEESRGAFEYYKQTEFQTLQGLSLKYVREEKIR